MKRLLLSIILTTTFTTSAFSDFIGFEAGAAYWNSSINGNIQKGNQTHLDLNNTLGLNDHDSSNYFWAIIEHPLPLLPNFKIERTNFSVSGKTNLNGSFNGNSFVINKESKLILNQTDFKFYYEILDNWVNADIGLNFKKIDGSLEIDTLKEDISAIIPMLYLKTKFDLPFTGLSAEADLNYISYSGSKYKDFKAGLVYETDIGFGATIGYKIQNLLIEDIDGFDAKLDIKGIYFGAFYHF